MFVYVQYIFTFFHLFFAEAEMRVWLSLTAETEFDWLLFNRSIVSLFISLKFRPQWYVFSWNNGLTCWFFQYPNTMLINWMLGLASAEQQCVKEVWTEHIISSSRVNGLGTYLRITSSNRANFVSFINLLI